MMYDFYAGRLYGVLKKSLKNSGIISTFPNTDYPNIPFILPPFDGSWRIVLVNEMYIWYINIYIRQKKSTPVSENYN